MASVQDDSPKPRLDQLPFEIRSIIVKHLADQREHEARGIDAPYIYRMSTPCARGLRALPATPRGLYGVGQEFLYRTIILYKLARYQYLLRTVINSPNLAQHIRSLVVFECSDIPDGTDPVDTTKPPRRKRRKRSNPHRKPKPRNRSSVTPLLQLRPLSEPMVRLWAAMPGIRHTSGLISEQHEVNTRDAALGLLDLIVNLPSLEHFRYIGLLYPSKRPRLYHYKTILSDNSTPFQEVFTSAISTLGHGAIGDIGLFKNLKDIDISGLNTHYWRGFLNSILLAPNVHTFRLTRLPYDDHKIDLTHLRYEDHQLHRDEWPGTLSSIRNLYIDTPFLHPETIAVMLKALQALEVLHFKFSFPGRVDFNVEHLHSAIHSHRKTLKDLRMNKPRSSHRRFRRPITFIPHPTWSEYPELVILHVPHTLLWASEANSSNHIWRLPPRLEALGITALEYLTTAELLSIIDLLSTLPDYRHQFPNLRDVTIPALPERRPQSALEERLEPHGIGLHNFYHSYPGSLP
ncbi:hypothetical protein BJX76DRAFT_355058 [Aspergillus varians]